MLNNGKICTICNLNNKNYYIQVIKKCYCTDCYQKLYEAKTGKHNMYLALQLQLIKLYEIHGNSIEDSLDIASYIRGMNALKTDYPIIDLDDNWINQTVSDINKL